MNAFQEIHARLTAASRASNVFLMEYASPGPCRIVIENPTDSQITAATQLAAEFNLECHVGEDDVVIEREYEAPCDFYEVRPPAVGNPWLPASQLPDDSLILAYIFTAAGHAGCAIREDGFWTWNDPAREPVKSAVTHWFRIPPAPDGSGDYDGDWSDWNR